MELLIQKSYFILVILNNQYLIVFICINGFEEDPQILLIFEVALFIIQEKFTIIDIAFTFLDLIIFDCPSFIN
jgi:hypothetical protein